jgi:hypothetical protein
MYDEEEREYRRKRGLFDRSPSPVRNMWGTTTSFGTPTQGMFFSLTNKPSRTSRPPSTTSGRMGLTARPLRAQPLQAMSLGPRPNLRGRQQRRPPVHGDRDMYESQQEENIPEPRKIEPTGKPQSMTVDVSRTRLPRTRQQSVERELDYQEAESGFKEWKEQETEAQEYLYTFQDSQEGAMAYQQMAQQYPQYNRDQASEATQFLLSALVRYHQSQGKQVPEELYDELYESLYEGIT